MTLQKAVLGYLFTATLCTLAAYFASGELKTSLAVGAFLGVPSGLKNLYLHYTRKPE